MKIKIVDHLSPEDVAMLQALYSRSVESVDVHLEKVQASGSGSFMRSYYVGYNHKSIADCGTTTLFIEGVSMLAAKAVQDWSLYSGQETSTRYVDVARQPIVDPVGNAASKAILDRWMAFYVNAQERVAATVRARHPRREDEPEKAYEGAVKARTFDILRGFLPAGLTTQLSWHTNLRQAGDHLLSLVHHPSAEIRQIALSIREQLAEKYASSGGGMSLPSVAGVARSEGAAEREAWERRVAQRAYHAPLLREHLRRGDLLLNRFFISNIADCQLSGDVDDAIRTRPRGCVLPHAMTDLGQLTFGFDLDFGSFRDLQRHRNGVCRMPLLTTDVGFEPWYLEQLGDLKKEAMDLVWYQADDIRRLTDDPVVRQYYTAFGFLVSCRVTYGLPAAVYVMELRSSKTVHPTLRRVVHEAMIRPFRDRYPEVTLHVDMDPDDWTVRRGKQTIERKP